MFALRRWLQGCAARSLENPSRGFTLLTAFLVVLQTDLRFQSNAVLALQEAAEAYLVGLFEGKDCGIFRKLAATYWLGFSRWLLLCLSSFVP